MRYHKITPYLFILPMVTGLVLFRYYPVLSVAVNSFRRWQMPAPPYWLGLGNYQEMFGSDQFWLVVRNTFAFAALYVPGVVIGALALALLIHQKVSGMSFFRGLYFMPYITSMVAVAMVWNWIFATRFGILNHFLRTVFHMTSIAWLAEKPYSLLVLILVSVWKAAGFQMLVFLAGLQAIPRSLYEAARVDGATSRQVFFRITLPLLSPVTFFIVVSSVIQAFQTFEVTYAMTQGKPFYASATLAYYVYENAFVFQRMGFASGLACVLVFLVGLVTLINFLFKDRWVHYQA
jgi:multiple sugar transport system permease protein